MGSTLSTRAGFAPGVGAKKVLIVEDDMTLKIIWQRVLKNLDFETHFDWATSEGTAIRAVDQADRQGRPYDVIVCDVFLSGNNTGIDLWRRLADRGVEFIFTSGVSGERLKTLLEGEQDFPPFLPKPLDPRLCVAVINSLLKKKPLVTEDSRLSRRRRVA